MCASIPFFKYNIFQFIFTRFIHSFFLEKIEYYLTNVSAPVTKLPLSRSEILVVKNNSSLPQLNCDIQYRIKYQKQV